jgi:iron complex outermembrane receptor protein
MSKTYRSLLATTVIAGFATAVPAYAQDTTTVPPPAAGATAPGGDTTPGSTDAGTTQNAGPGVQPAEAVPPAPSEGGEIVVTGTLIRNPNLTSSSPVAVVGQEEIHLRQASSAEQILRDTPGVVPNLGGNVNNGQNGQARIDLRGLGAKRNLVLLDSTRMVPSSFFGAVDLNNIPLALIDRVDVLTGGASTTYGADAVSGVVNFITKKNFAGIDLQVSEGITEKGDSNTFRADLALGANFDDGRGNAVMSVGYIESDPLYFGDRPFGECVLNSNSGFCGGDSPTATPTSFGFTGVDTNLQVAPAGSTGDPLIPQFALFNFNPYNIYQVPFRRFNGYAAAHYDVSDNVTVYGRSLFSKNTISSIVAPSGVFGEELTIPGWSPFLTTALRNQLCTLNGIALGAGCDTNAAIPLGIVYRRTPEVGPRIDEFTTNIFDLKAGVTWNITNNISFDLYGAYGESENTQVRKNYVAKSRLQQALNVSQADPTVCANASGGCVPLNLFGQPGSITPAMAGFIGGITSSIANIATLAQVHGVVSGDVGFSMPWANAPVSFAVGGEHRDYTAERRPDNLAQVPGELGGAGGAITPLKGGYTAEDAFGELIVPIAADRPFFDELTLEAGIRHSHYVIDAPGTKPTFKATTWKLGGTWAPIPEVKFRGNYQKAVRAPNIGELFAPTATGLTNLGIDPCAGTNPVGNANLTAVCIAQGAPVSSIGSIQQPAAGQANVTTGGNPFLSPETARTYTVGVVFAPRQWLPGFNATFDYYHIKVTDAITTPLPTDIINACFGDNLGGGVGAGSAADPACTAIRRNPTNGRLSGSPATTPGLPAPLGNFGTIRTDGFDLTANYKHNIGFADLILNFAGNYTKHASQQIGSGPVGPNCPGVYSVNCGLALGQLQPKFAWNQRTTLSFKPVDVSLLWRHIGKFHYQSDLPQLFSGTITCTNDFPLCGKQVNLNRIPAYNYFDLTTRFSITDHYELTLSAFNLLNKQPAIVGNTAGSTTAGSGNTFPSTYDALGRRYAATVRLKF